MNKFIKDESKLKKEEYDSIPREFEKCGIKEVKDWRGETYISGFPALDNSYSDLNGKYKKVVCGHCGNTKFEALFTCDYETSLRCLKCGVYFVIHDG